MVKFLSSNMNKSILNIPILQNGTFFNNADFYDMTARCFHYILGMIEKQFTKAIVSVLR